MLDVTITLKSWYCKCGSVYAAPNWIGDYDHTCPVCAAKKIREANKRADEEAEKWMHMERKITSLRGVITRMRRSSKERS